MIETLATIGILLLIVLLTVMASFNGLVQLRQQVRAAWSDMDEQLKQRYALLPILAGTIQAAGAEGAVPLAAVLAAKNQAAVAFSPSQLAGAERVLSAAIRQVFTASATEPALKSNSRFDQIREKLLASEAAIHQSREQYNQAVLAYNSAVSSFPNSMTAIVFGFGPQIVFEV
jgi:LemA protein